MMDILEGLEALGLDVRKKSTNEYASACPYCKDGDDRFIVWPAQGAGGRFHCRRCEKSGDAITLARDFFGLTFLEAKLSVTGSLRSKPGQCNHTLRSFNPSRFPHEEEPSRLWGETAGKIVSMCHETLLDDFCDVFERRGISLSTVKRYKLGYNSKDLFCEPAVWGVYDDDKKIWLPEGLVIPSFDFNGRLIKMKLRNARYNPNSTETFCLSKYVVVKGSKKCPSVFGDRSTKKLFVMESELDAILMTQETKFTCFCMALGGSTQLNLDADSDSVVAGAEKVFFVPDMDQAGKLAWLKWQRLYPQSILALPPSGKDLTESFLEGHDLNDWVKDLTS